jgi:hypothetical protein
VRLERGRNKNIGEGESERERIKNLNPEMRNIFNNIIVNS